VKKLKDRSASSEEPRTQRAGRVRSGVFASRSWAIPTPASRRSSTASRAPQLRRRPALRDPRHDDAQALARRRRAVALSDTVGFIRDCRTASSTPSARRSKRTAQADLLLHVIDAPSPQRDEQLEAVNAVLNEIGAAKVPQIVVWNKIDQRPGLEPEVVRDSCGKILNIKVSAASGAGIDLLRDVLAEAAREAARPLASAA
jgi:GTP-binding protein HflX